MLNSNPIPFNVSLASQVVKTGKTINLSKNEESANSFMCMAIRDPDGRIMGVISLIDKDNDSGCNTVGFSANDER